MLDALKPGDCAAARGRVISRTQEFVSMRFEEGRSGRVLVLPIGEVTAVAPVEVLPVRLGSEVEAVGEAGVYVLRAIDGDVAWLAPVGGGARIERRVAALRKVGRG